MKTIYIYLSSIIFLFAGCSSVYTVNDFSSKEKLYEDCSSSIADKHVTVNMMNDSSFCPQYVSIEKDSLIVSSVKHGTPVNINISLSDIKDISYSKVFAAKDTMRDADILLKSGIKLSLENIHFLHDDLTGSFFPSVAPTKIPVDNIRSVVYKTHTVATISGILCGAVGTFAVLAAVLKGGNTSDSRPLQPHSDGFSPSYIVIGSIIGGATG